MNSTFGVHPNQSEIFEKWVQDPQFVVHVGRANERLIAVAASNISRSQDFSQYEVFGLSAVTHLKKNSLGWFLNLAVHPDFRKQKIGFQMAKAQAECLIANGCTALVGTSWVSGSKDNSKHLFEKAGFKKLSESTSFLRLQLKDSGITCAACKKADCDCTSILYAIEVGAFHLPI